MAEIRDSGVWSMDQQNLIAWELLEMQAPGPYSTCQRAVSGAEPMNQLH